MDVSAKIISRGESGRDGGESGRRWEVRTSQLESI